MGGNTSVMIGAGGVGGNTSDMIGAGWACEGTLVT